MPPAPATPPTDWELGVAYILHLWPALTLAVTSEWGGPDSHDKRDWLCGAIADMFPPLDGQMVDAGVVTATREPDELDVEDTLEQVLGDEFEVELDDESAMRVSKQIMSLRNSLLQGDTGPLALLRTQFETSKARLPSATPVGNDDGDDDDDDEDEEMQDADADADTGESRRNGRPEPVVDDDRFELVRRRR